MNSNIFLLPASCSGIPATAPSPIDLCTQTLMLFPSSVKERARTWTSSNKDDIPEPPPQPSRSPSSSPPPSPPLQPQYPHVLPPPSSSSFPHSPPQSPQSPSSLPQSPLLSPPRPQSPLPPPQSSPLLPSPSPLSLSLSPPHSPPPSPLPPSLSSPPLSQSQSPPTLSLPPSPPPSSSMHVPQEGEFAIRDKLCIMKGRITKKISKNKMAEKKLFKENEGFQTLASWATLIKLVLEDLPMEDDPFIVEPHLNDINRGVGDLLGIDQQLNHQFGADVLFRFLRGGLPGLEFVQDAGTLYVPINRNPKTNLQVLEQLEGQTTNCYLQICFSHFP